MAVDWETTVAIGSAVVMAVVGSMAVGQGVAWGSTAAVVGVRVKIVGFMALVTSVVNWEIMEIVGVMESITTVDSMPAVRGNLLVEISKVAF